MKIDPEKLSDVKLAEIQNFLIQRFTYFSSLRQSLDDALEEEINIYNNIDKNIDSKAPWEEKYRVPYTYTIVQTMTARLIQSLFDRDDYVKIFVENEKYVDQEESITKWAQEELDKIKLKSRARDFIEDALVQRTSWLQLMPIVEGGTLKKIDFQILKFRDVWFDTMATNVEETDMFVRKKVRLYKIKQNEDVYFNLDEIDNTTPPEDIKGKQEYEAKQGTQYYDPQKNSVTDDVELLEYYGTYDMSEDKEKPDYQDVIFVLANRQLLIRMDTVELKTQKKKLIFPMRPLRQANSLIGKGIPQIVKDLQYELNEYRSLRAQNSKLLAKLMFKYRKQSGIDLEELFAKGGNAVGWEDDPNDIGVFQIPNLVNELTYVAQDVVNDMQQVTGAVDYVMGTSGGRGTTDTASGIRTITEQAMFKFSMMVGNLYDDIMDFINFVLILWMKYGKEDVVLRYPEIIPFLDQTETMMEDTHVFDIAISDPAQRKDVERSQWINAMGVIAQLAQPANIDMQALTKQFLIRLGVDNVNYLFKQAPEGGDMAALLQQAMGAAGAPGATPPPGGVPQSASPSQATPEEMMFNENVKRT